ncbi:MAG: hypothetical protein J6Y80_06835, partial [Victivallales bacterium]|nr:hypothetical protein [Victivallales bacterium]
VPDVLEEPVIPDPPVEEPPVEELPVEEPPVEELPVEEPPVEEPPKILKPDTPVAEPPKVEEPKPPKPPEPPKKTREEEIRERLQKGKVIDNSKENERRRREQEQARKRALERINSTANAFKPSVSSTRSTSVANVPAGQMARFNTYMANCATPKVSALWQQLGPNGLDNPPTPALLRIIVAPSGKVTSFLIATPSNSKTMNQCAEALGNALMREGLPPFRQVNLNTSNNAALTLDFTLEYRR